MATNRVYQVRLQCAWVAHTFKLSIQNLGDSRRNTSPESKTPGENRIFLVIKHWNWIRSSRKTFKSHWRWRIKRGRDSYSAWGGGHLYGGYSVNICIPWKLATISEENKPRKACRNVRMTRRNAVRDSEFINNVSDWLEDLHCTIAMVRRPLMDFLDMIRGDHQEGGSKLYTRQKHRKWVAISSSDVFTLRN